MSFHILYVEDNERHKIIMEKALSEVNKSHPRRLDIQMTCIDHPSEIPDAFTKNHDIDIVLADLFFDNSENDSLDDIIDYVREWDKKSPHGFPTSIIAYTSGGTETLKKCFERRKYLYDIWHKLSANPDYVAWRFQELQKDLPRHRPDATIQRLIISMPSVEYLLWHDKVLLMIKGYGEGQTEREQIKKCRPQLLNILDSIAPEHASSLIALWDALVSSEPLLRASSPRLRGIARHSINVFWLGYWLINHSSLKNIINSSWNDMLKRRKGCSLSPDNSMSDLNTTWLIASLFHDAGKFHEYSKCTVEKFANFFNKFNSLGTGFPSWQHGSSQTIVDMLDDLFFEIAKTSKDKMVKVLNAHIKKCSEDEKYDHGAIAAAYMSSLAEKIQSKDKYFASLIKEAARAVMFHSCLPEVLSNTLKNEATEHLQLNWNEDLISCILLLCDQIQTWDRHDPDDPNLDYPDRAELSFLDVNYSGTDKASVTGRIDYIAPSRVDMYPQLREDIANTLNSIILERPKNTLLNVIERGQWPFNVHFDCALSGEKLDIDMDFS